MRIAYLCQSYPPMVSGAAVVAKRLAEEIVARGHSVLVMSASDAGPSVTFPSSRFTHVRLHSFQNPLRVGHSSTLWASRKVRAVLADFAPDVIHMHDPLTLGLAGLRFANRLGIPVVLTLHQLASYIAIYIPDIPGVRRIVCSGLWAYGDWLVRQCDRVIVPSHSCARDIWGQIGYRPVVISNGVDLNQFTPNNGSQGENMFLCEKYGLDPNRPIIIHVGRLDVDKNVDVIIRAAALTMDQVKAQLLVVGDGCQRKNLMRLSDELGIGDCAHFPGYIEPDGDLPGLYRLASVFVSASEIETQGLVILEAMASSLPVVAVRATSIPELIHDAINGYLTRPGDIPQMSDRITRLLSFPDKAAEMGRAGRELVKDHAINYSVQQHEQLYKQVIQEKIDAKKFEPAITTL